MKVVNLRIVLPDDVEAAAVMRILSEEEAVHGIAELNSDGFGRLLPDMPTAVVGRYATEHEFRAVHSGLAYGWL